MGKMIPYKHQERGIKYLTTRMSSFLFFKQRTGKTKTSVWACKELDEYPILVIAPKVVMQVWDTAFKEEGVRPSCISMVDSSSKKKNEESIARNSHITICNFEKVKNYDILNVRQWKIVIIDESHRLANISSQITRYFLRNRRPEYQRRFLLTGTPAPESQLNLVTQYLIAQGNFMGYTSYNKYLLKHWEKSMYSGKWEKKIPSHTEVIKNYVKNTACIVSMENIGKGAKFVFSKLYVPMNNVQKQLYTKTEAIYEQTKYFDEGMDTLDPAKMVKRLNQKLISAGVDPYNDHEVISTNKAKKCVEYWEYLQEPVLVVSTFREPMQIAIEEFKKAGARVGVIHGDIKYEEREAIRAQFMRGELDAIVAQTKSIEVGLDFSVAHTIMVLCNSDSGGSREQLIERINHMNATEVKQVIDIMSQGSNDDKVQDGLDKKGESSMSYFK